MIFADCDLARRLERAEGRSCLEFAEARRGLDLKSGATWIECSGAYAVFDGVDSPVTQSFGLGLFEPTTPAALDTMEAFFRDRGAAVVHEVSPMAGVETMALLCARGYRPIELSTVLYRTVRQGTRNHGSDQGAATARVARTDEQALWAQTSARGWSHDQPEMAEFLEQLGRIAFARPKSINFLGELDGVAGAAGGLSLHEGVALFAGASTLPAMRQRGLQGALLETRMQYAFEQRCDLAMMVTAVGSQSQRNAERLDFRVAYTRTKWCLQAAV